MSIELSSGDAPDVYPKVLYFTAKWCGPCQKISLPYENLAVANPHISFYKIDVDKNEELTSKYSVSSMPTFFFIKSSREYQTFSGANIEKLNVLVNWLNSSTFM